MHVGSALAAIDDSEHRNLESLIAAEAAQKIRGDISGEVFRA